MSPTLAMTHERRQHRYEKPLKVFCSYSHRDERLLERLRSHLNPLERNGSVLWWHDRKISAGSEWHAEIGGQLEAAHIILLLVSADFLSSDYIHDQELRRALEKHAAGNAR